MQGLSTDILILSSGVLTATGNNIYVNGFPIGTNISVTGGTSGISVTGGETLAGIIGFSGAGPIEVSQMAGDNVLFSGYSNISKLNSNVSNGASSITVNSISIPTQAGFGFIAIDPYTLECEIRKVNSISNKTLSFNIPLAYSHAKNDLVYFFESTNVSTSWFGAKGDNTTDDESALQNGLIEVSRIGAWLDGHGQSYRINRPLIAGPSQYFKSTRINAGPSYAPQYLGGAMLMNQQGGVVFCSGDSSTQKITTSAAHGMINGMNVVFKGTGLPSGVTGGRVYYVTNVTGNFFNIAETNSLTPIVDLISTGSGMAFTECPSLHRVFLDDVYIDGQNKAVNGAALGLQQPAFLRKVRIDNCSGAGLVLYGQHAEFYGLQLINNTVGLAMENASFMYFFGFNVEGTVCQKAIHCRPATGCTVFQLGGGGVSSNWVGVHLENSIVPTAIGFDIELGGNLNFKNITTSFRLPEQRLVYAHAGSSASSSYVLEDVFFSAASDTGLLTAILDTDRGQLIRAWDPNGTCRRYIAHYQAAANSTSSVSPDRYPNMFLGTSGGFLGYGSQQPAVESFCIQANSGQTADQILCKDKFGSGRVAVNKDGYIKISQNTLPDSLDISNRELFFWFDPIASGIRFKGKSAVGTVITGGLNLIP